jgi:hypothetical protein
MHKNITRGAKSLKRVLWSPWYAFFLAAYPALALLSTNITQVKDTVAIRSLVFSWLAVGLLFLIFRLIYRNAHRAARAPTRRRSWRASVRLVKERPPISARVW